MSGKHGLGASLLLYILLCIVGYTQCTGGYSVPANQHYLC